MPRDWTELPATADGRTLGAWGRVDLILRLPATTARKLLLVVIARMESRRDGECWASMTTMARESSLSRQWVWQQIETMEAEGLIGVAGRQKGRRTMRIEIRWERIEEMASQGKTCQDRLQVQADDLNPFGPDEESSQSGLQVEGEADASCPVSLQDERDEAKTCPPRLKVAAPQAESPATCKLVPSNLSTLTPEPVNPQAPTCRFTLHKGSEGSTEGKEQGAACSALSSSYTPSPLPVEGKPEEPEPIVPGSTLTTSEIEARKRMVESMRPAWARKVVASGSAR